MPERIVLGRALREAAQIVVRIVHAAGEMQAFARDPVAFVDDGGADRAGASRPYRIAFRVGHLYLQRKNFAGFYRAGGFYDDLRREVVEAAYFVVRSPLAPVAWCVFEQPGQARIAVLVVM